MFIPFFLGSLAIFVSVMAMYILNYSHFDIFKDLEDGDNHFVVIGIMSAPSNFDLRQMVRTSWGNMAKHNKLQYYFLIGSHICVIPPADRVDEYTCDEWPMLLEPEVTDSTEHSTSAFDCDERSHSVPLNLGFSFIVQHPIVVKRLTILKSIVTQLQRVTVTLRESTTGEKITSATFTANNNDPPSSAMLLTKSVEAYLLPKGFEGQIFVDVNDWFPMNISCLSRWMHVNSAVRLIQLIKRRDERPHVFKHDSFTPISIIYTIHEVDQLRKHIATRGHRFRAWRRETAILQAELTEESEIAKDILFLDVVDVYRNLPKKLLLFFQWVYANRKFSFLMKVDDDSFVDVPIVVRELYRAEGLMDGFCRAWWWSSFREGWSTQVAGKWREIHYRSPTYPPFPCGAGYVMSYNTVQYLAKNADSLYTGFQGEDVSVGIWLAGLNPCRHGDANTPCTWSCDEYKTRGVCNRAQLTIQEMITVWDHYKEKRTLSV